MNVGVSAMNSERATLIGILKRLLAQDIGADDAQDQIFALTMAEFDDVFANLHHYLHDADIRNRDAKYRQFQEEELSKLIGHLEAGNISAAQRVSFLHVSNGI